MKILFIFTGGTIGSAVTGGYISPDSNAPSLLLKKYDERYTVDFDHDMIMPFTMLSENSDGTYIYKLINTVRKVLGSGAQEYDGIVVTHGTDTQTYSASALSWVLGKTQIPVCIVSSDKPLEDDTANGVDNLAGAVNLIRRAKESGRKELCGVSVPYRNHDGMVYFHRPLYLTEAGAFTDEIFSLKDRFFMTFDKRDKKVTENSSFDHCLFDKEYAYYRDMKEWEVPEIGEGLTQTSDHILRIKAYPGMVIPELNDSVRYIIFETYHSGTVNSEFTGYKAFFDKAYERGIKVFLTGVSRGVSYESTAAFGRMHLIPAYDISPSALYMRLWMAAQISRL